MSEFNRSLYHPETLAVRAGHVRTNEGEQSEPIFTSASYVFANAAEAAARFSGQQPGNIYSRFTNPTVRTFEERLAVLEKGECAVATGSGMAAILSVCMALLKSGDHLVAANGLFGATAVLFNQYLSRFGVETSYVPLTDLEGWRSALRPNTRVLFLETPANPLTELADIAALAQLAHAHGCLLIVDNTLCTAALQQPLVLGADLVVLSATKYIDGQGRGLGGAVVGGKTLMKEVQGFLRTAGPSLSPFHAWIFLKGLETLMLRMQAHCTHALALAQWLERQPAVSRVHYPGLSSHPQHALAQRQQRGLGGGMLSFEVQGGREAAWTVIDNTRLISITANLGDTKTTITHPATTTHGRLPSEMRHAAGIGDNLVRVAVGLENVEDLKIDLTRGLSQI